jgi:hypothetical protein
VLNIDNASVNSALRAAGYLRIFFYFPDGFIVNELTAVKAVAPSRTPDLYHSWLHSQKAP